MIFLRHGFLKFWLLCTMGIPTTQIKAMYHFTNHSIIETNNNCISIKHNNTCNISTPFNTRYVNIQHTLSLTLGHNKKSIVQQKATPEEPGTQRLELLQSTENAQNINISPKNTKQYFNGLSTPPPQTDRETYIYQTCLFLIEQYVKDETTPQNIRALASQGFINAFTAEAMNQVSQHFTPEYLLALKDNFDKQFKPLKLYFGACNDLFSNAITDWLKIYIKNNILEFYKKYQNNMHNINKNNQKIKQNNQDTIIKQQIKAIGQDFKNKAQNAKMLHIHTLINEAVANFVPQPTEEIKIQEIICFLNKRRKKFLQTHRDFITTAILERFNWKEITQDLVNLIVNEMLQDSLNIFLQNHSFHIKKIKKLIEQAYHNVTMPHYPNYPANIVNFFWNQFSPSIFNKTKETVLYDIFKNYNIKAIKPEIIQNIVNEKLKLIFINKINAQDKNMLQLQDFVMHSIKKFKPKKNISQYKINFNLILTDFKNKLKSQEENSLKFYVLENLGFKNLEKGKVRIALQNKLEEDFLEFYKKNKTSPLETPTKPSPFCPEETTPQQTITPAEITTSQIINSQQGTQKKSKKNNNNSKNKANTTNNNTSPTPNISKVNTTIPQKPSPQLIDFSDKNINHANVFNLALKSKNSNTNLTDNKELYDLSQTILLENNRYFCPKTLRALTESITEILYAEYGQIIDHIKSYCASLLNMMISNKIKEMCPQELREATMLHIAKNTQFNETNTSIKRIHFLDKKEINAKVKIMLNILQHEDPKKKLRQHNLNSFNHFANSKDFLSIRDSYEKIFPKFFKLIESSVTNFLQIHSARKIIPQKDTSPLDAKVELLIQNNPHNVLLPKYEKITITPFSDMNITKNIKLALRAQINIFTDLLTLVDSLFILIQHKEPFYYNQNAEILTEKDFVNLLNNKNTQEFNNILTDIFKQRVIILKNRSSLFEHGVISADGFNFDNLKNMDFNLNTFDFNKITNLLEKNHTLLTKLQKNLNGQVSKKAHQTKIINKILPIITDILIYNKKLQHTNLQEVFSQIIKSNMQSNKYKNDSVILHNLLQVEEILFKDLLQSKNLIFFMQCMIDSMDNIKHHGYSRMLPKSIVLHTCFFNLFDFYNIVNSTDTIIHGSHVSLLNTLAHAHTIFLQNFLHISNLANYPQQNHIILIKTFLQRFISQYIDNLETNTQILREQLLIQKMAPEVVEELIEEQIGKNSLKHRHIDHISTYFLETYWEIFKHIIIDTFINMSPLLHNSIYINHMEL